MNLVQMFPGHGLHMTVADVKPPLWKKILLLTGTEVEQLLTMYFSGSEAPNDRRITVEEVGVLVPLKKRLNKDVRYFKLGFRTSGKSALYFNHPIEEMSRCNVSLPEEYVRFIKELGLLHFSQSSGSFIWPASMEKTNSEIASIIGENGRHGNVTAFFDHGTGDYDCWLDDDWERIWTFDHEKREMSLQTSNGFSSWLWSNVPKP